MSRLAISFAVTAMLLIAAEASAQPWELGALVGYTPSANIGQKAREIDDLSIQGGFTWGVQVGRTLTPHWSAELLWTYQPSSFQADAAGSTGTFFDMTVQQLHANGVYTLGASDAHLRPFVFGGLGATFFSAKGLDSEAKFSLGLGGGVKYYPAGQIGLRAQFRYKPTFLNDEDSADFCDPFGFCQNTLTQVEFTAGISVRF